MVQPLALHLCDLVFQFEGLAFLGLRSLKSVRSVVLFSFFVHASVLTLFGTVSLDKLEFFLESCDLLVSLLLVEGPLGNELSAQVLHLLGETSLDGIDLLAHDRPPDAVQLIEDLRDASLGHLPAKGLLNLLDLSNCFSRDPLILQVRPVQTFAGGSSCHAVCGLAPT